MMHQFSLRVYYHDTDQMGVVYYANYIKWFEMARTELLRDAGKSYKECEAEDVFLPVVECNCKYYKPAKYDDLITVNTTVSTKSKVRITFTHQVYNQLGEHLADATVVLCCLDGQGKIQGLSELLKSICVTYSSENETD